MGFSGLGVPELLVILVLVLILFGAGRLPQVFGQLGKGIRSFRDAQRGDDEGPEARPRRELPEHAPEPDADRVADRARESTR